MNHDEHDDLWRLLGKAKKPAPSPFFARNVLRAVRQEAQDPVGWAHWLRIARHWRWAALSGVAALVLALSLPGLLPSGTKPPASDPLVELAQNIEAAPDLAVIGHLDELLAYEENSVWTNNTDY